MPGKTPRNSGKPNGVKSNKDAEKKDASKSKSKKAVKDVDEEMTVVVPPSKSSKQSSAPPPADTDGDVAMGDEDKADETADKVDPVAQTIAGERSQRPQAIKRFQM